MARTTLGDSVADQLLERIIEGMYAVGTALPAEASLGEELNVSRLTVREAMKSLRAKNVVEARRGSGTFVNPPSIWTSLEAVVQAMSAGGAADTSIQLLEVRRMIEVGSAQLAASRRTEADLLAMAGHLTTMRGAHAAGDLDAFVAADLAFHDVILKATGNIMVAALYDPLDRLLARGRRETSAVSQIQGHAIAMHEDILTALAAGNPEASRDAMEAHMVQTRDDLLHFVLDGNG